MEAQYYSGKQSRGVRVSLSRQEGALTILFPQGESQTVELADLDIEPSLGGMARHIRLPDGASLEVADTETLNDWFAGKNVIERVAHWLERRWPIVIASALITLVFGWAVYQYGLPAAAERIAYNVPLNWQQALSRQTEDLLKRFGMTESKLPDARLNALSERANAMFDTLPDPARYTLRFKHAPMFGPNAFATAGGRMFILDDLIELTDDDEEILAVIAHELGHAYYRHPLRGLIQSSFLSVVTTILVGDVSGLATLPLYGLQANYTRSFEREADDFAIEMLRQQNISPEKMATMFEKLRAKVGSDGESSWLSTHPGLNDRIEKARAAAGHDHTD